MQEFRDIDVLKEAVEDNLGILIGVVVALIGV
jgi:hypothetical protein